MSLLFNRKRLNKSVLTISAGRLAGLLPFVIQRARDVMKEIERNSTIAVGLRGEKQKPPRFQRRAKENNGVYDLSEQLDLFGA